MEKKLFAYFFPSADEDGSVPEGIVDLTGDALAMDTIEDTRQNVASFLAQTNESYIDKWGVVHEVTAHKDQPFAWYFEVVDNCWEDVLGEAGELLDDSLNKDMPEDIRAGIVKVYDFAYKKVI